MREGVIAWNQMPEVSRFFGIVIRMYFDEHNPPHFHALYAGNEAQIGIDPITTLEGKLPNRAASMVIEWAALHQHELMQNRHRLRNDRPMERIEPLE
jgi:hypothetical protein